MSNITKSFVGNSKVDSTKSNSNGAGPKTNPSIALDRRCLEKIRLVVGESDDRKRTDLCNILTSMGFTKVSAHKDLDSIRANIAENLADFVICASDIEGKDFLSVIRDVRRQKTGENPFLFISCVVDSSDSEVVRACVDSGADDLIISPLAAATVSSRVAKLAKHRKPFVVTRDYIGPDRQQMSRGGESIPGLDAPNIYRFLKDGSRGQGFFENIVKKSAATLKDRWAERQAIQVAYLVEQRLPILAQGAARTVEITNQDIDYFSMALRAAESSLVGTKYASEGMVLDTLSMAMTRACASRTPDPQDLASLKMLAEMLRKTFAGETPVQPGESKPIVKQPG